MSKASSSGKLKKTEVNKALRTVKKKATNLELGKWEQKANTAGTWEAFVAKGQASLPSLFPPSN